MRFTGAAGARAESTSPTAQKRTGIVRVRIVVTEAPTLCVRCRGNPAPTAHPGISPRRRRVLHSGAPAVILHLLRAGLVDSRIRLCRFRWHHILGIRARQQIKPLAQQVPCVAHVFCGNRNNRSPSRTTRHDTSERGATELVAAAIILSPGNVKAKPNPCEILPNFLLHKNKILQNENMRSYRVRPS